MYVYACVNVRTLHHTPTTTFIHSYAYMNACNTGRSIRTGAVGALRIVKLLLDNVVTDGMCVYACVRVCVCVSVKV